MAAVIGVGVFNLTIALAVLGIPPILTNTFVGIRQVDRATVDAARGIGMTEFEILRKVELPLAMPSVMTGIRGATINIVATATIAPLAGVLTLGDFIINENVYGDNGVLAGAIVVALLALVFEFALAAVAASAHLQGPEAENRVTCPKHTQGGTTVRFDKTRLRMALAVLIGARHWPCGVAACGSSSDSSEASNRRSGEEGGGGDRLQSRERQGQPDDRLEELPRTGNPRGNLHPGPGGGRLQGQERPQPRLRNRGA